MFVNNSANKCIYHSQNISHPEHPIIFITQNKQPRAQYSSTPSPHLPDLPRRTHQKAFLSRIQKCDDDGLVKYATYFVQMAAMLTSSRPPSLGQWEKERMLEDHSSTLGRKMVYDADDRPAFWPQPMTGWTAYEVSAFSYCCSRLSVSDVFAR
ncbi:hypothetical protein TNCT_679061 [Trichonephila clavata]|uniref:Uncharacterized protein n=1 Tax=Trichonephila clavata TaxID=2740835 RepID=A0A8X6HZY2_TRICU|nr:hypothetical protein TNCT_679061 [Trichonephila clavata]